MARLPGRALLGCALCLTGASGLSRQGPQQQPEAPPTEQPWWEKMAQMMFSSPPPDSVFGKAQASPPGTPQLTPAWLQNQPQVPPAALQPPLPLSPQMLPPQPPPQQPSFPMIQSFMPPWLQKSAPIEPPHMTSVRSSAPPGEEESGPQWLDLPTADGPTSTPPPATAAQTTPKSEPPLSTSPSDTTMQTTPKPEQPPSTSPPDTTAQTTQKPKQPQPTSPPATTVQTAPKPNQPPPMLPPDTTAQITQKPRPPQPAFPPATTVQTAPKPNQPPPMLPPDTTAQTTQKPRPPQPAFPPAATAQTAPKPNQPPPMLPPDTTAQTAQEPRPPQPALPPATTAQTAPKPNQPPPRLPLDTTAQKIQEPKPTPSKLPAWKPRKPSPMPTPDTTAQKTLEHMQPPPMSPLDATAHTIQKPKPAPSELPVQKMSVPDTATQEARKSRQPVREAKPKAIRRQAPQVGELPLWARGDGAAGQPTEASEEQGNEEKKKEEKEVHEVAASASRNLAFMHIPFNFGHTIEKVGMFKPGTSNDMIEHNAHLMSLWGGSEQPSSWASLQKHMRPFGEVWGQMNPYLQAKSNVTGCDMYYTPQRYWPEPLAEKYFGDRKAFGLLRDPFERLVSIFRSHPESKMQGCDVDSWVKNIMADYIKGNRYQLGCALIPQAEYTYGDHGIRLAVDSRWFPHSMNEFFLKNNYTDFHISADDIAHATTCPQVWAGDIKEDTRSLVREVYKNDFELLCRLFGYCDPSENTCLGEVPGMCPDNVIPAPANIPPSYSWRAGGYAANLLVPSV